MHHQVAQVRRSNRFDRLFFVNVLSQHLRVEAVDDEPDYDMMILVVP